jgi:hypothetical protein
MSTYDSGGSSSRPDRWIATPETTASENGSEHVAAAIETWGSPQPKRPSDTRADAKAGLAQRLGETPYSPPRVPPDRPNQGLADPAKPLSAAGDSARSRSSKVSIARK